MKLSRGEKIFQVINYVFLSILTLIFVIPFLSVVATSLTSGSEFARRGQFILFPYRPVLAAYQMLLGRGSVVRRAFLVSLWRVTVGTGLNLLFTFPLAYVLSKRHLTGRTALTLLIFFTMLFSGGLIPNFVLIERLGLLDRLWALVLPGLVNPGWMLIMRNFLMSIPDELEEAAVMDGATPPVILTRIVLPLSLPSMATIGLWYAVAHWNAWFDAAIYINDYNKMPLQLLLRDIMIRRSGPQAPFPGLAEALEMLEPPPAESLRAAMIIVTTLPIVLVYPFIQRYFV